MTLTISTIRCLLPSCALALLMAACAPLAPQQTEYPVGRARLALPAGAWEDLGVSEEAVTVLPAPESRIALQTRAVALRGEGGELLAVLRVQTNRDNYPRSPAVNWTGACPQQRGVLVEDATAGSPVRVDCLRLKRWVEGDPWLEKNAPDFAQWLSGHRIALPLDKPHSHLNYRYATANSALVEVDVLADQRLLRPRTRNNEEFLAAGRPALQWAHDLTRAARLSASMMDGHLAVPPFPFTVP